MARRIGVPGYDNTSVGELSDGYHTFDELYEHRCSLFAVLMSKDPSISWFSKTHDDNSVWDGWFICGMKLSTGDVTYHLPDSMWDMVVNTGAKELDKAPPWDGHTSSDVVARLQGLLK